MRKYLRLSLLLAVVAGGLSQSENQPYFALSSNQTFWNALPAIGLYERLGRGLAGVPRLPRGRPGQILSADREPARIRRAHAGAPA